MSEKYKECPFCGEILDYKAKICSKCHKKLNIDKILQEEKQKKQNKKQKNLALLKNSFKKIVVALIIINIMVFATVWADQAKSNVNRPAKLFLSSAAAINIMYVFPIYKVFGWDSPVAKPFCFVRNILYEQGLKRIPKDDGERECWWFVIRFVEFDKFVNASLSKLAGKQILNERDYSKEIKKYKVFTDEVYQHIFPLATLKIKDEHLRSRRYNMFIVVTNSYIQSRMGVFLCTKPYIKYGFDDSNFEIDRLKRLESLVLNRKEYYKKHEPEGYNYFYNKTTNFYLEDLVLHVVSGTIIEHKLRNHSLICNDKDIEIYGESRKILRNYFFDSSLPSFVRQDINLNSVGLISPAREVYAYCPNNPHLDLVKKDIDFSDHPIPKRLQKKYENIDTNGAIPIEFFPKP